jgi:hypothetical protein
VPVAIEVGLVPLLKDLLVLSNASTSVSTLGAVMTCLRALTNKSLGARAVLDEPDLCQAILCASTVIMNDWYAYRDQLAIIATCSSSTATAEVVNTLHTSKLDRIRCAQNVAA